VKPAGELEFDEDGEHGSGRGGALPDQLVDQNGRRTEELFDFFAQFDLTPIIGDRSPRDGTVDRLAKRTSN
jgi:hypothetical protein